MYYVLGRYILDGSDEYIFEYNNFFLNLIFNNFVGLSLKLFLSIGTPVLLV